MLRCEDGKGLLEAQVRRERERALSIQQRMWNYTSGRGGKREEREIPFSVSDGESPIIQEAHRILCVLLSATLIRDLCLLSRASQSSTLPQHISSGTKKSAYPRRTGTPMCSTVPDSFLTLLHPVLFLGLPVTPLLFALERATTDGRSEATGTN